MSSDFANQLATLKELQDIDRQIRQITLELEKMPGERQTRGAEYFAMSKVLQDKQSHLDAINKERLDLEGQLKEAGEQLQNREKRLNAIQTPKEYQAAVKEVAQIKQANKIREERVLKLMEEGEKLNQEITQLKPLFSDKELEFKTVEEELIKRETEVGQLKAELESKRPEWVQKIDPAVLKKYDMVRRRFSDALAGIKRGICMGCHLNIPPQLYNEMLKTAALRHCPNCQRLIYPIIETVDTVEA